MSIIQHLSRELGVSVSEIATFSINAPKRYKVYSIPKRRGGLRTIAHPSKSLKVYQRALKSILEERLRIHRCAFAYVKDSSIKKNAEAHKKNRYLLKMDFEDFFNSITPDLFFRCLEKTGFTFSGAEKEVLRKVLFWNPSKKKLGKLVLSVGAPSSPVVSNAVMYTFDDSISKYCDERSIVYTRYADDITFSTNRRDALFEVPKFVYGVLERELFGRIRIKLSKTVFSSKAHNRHVTGITITNEGRLSLGRDRKRYIKSLIHKFKMGELAQEDISHLKGLYTFACHIEADFECRMSSKYGVDTIIKIKSFDHE